MERNSFRRAARHVNQSGRLLLSAGFGVLSLTFAPYALAQDIPDEEISDLGTLGGGNSSAFGVSADGNIVFGYAEDEGGTIRLTLWQNGVARDVTPDGAVFFSNVFGVSGSQRILMSSDGSTLAGNWRDDQNNITSFITRNGVAVPLQGSSDFNIEAISADGSTLTGTAIFGVNAEAFRYTDAGLEALSRLSDVPLPPGQRGSNGSAINADGSVIVGHVWDPLAGPQAVRWLGSVVEDLGTLPGAFASEALGVSADGNVVAGSIFVRDNDGRNANRVFVWRDGAMTDIGDLGGGTTAFTAISSDGSTVIGRSQHINPDVDPLPQSYYWRDGEIHELAYLPTEFPRGQYQVARALSADGNVIVGNGRSLDGTGRVALRWENGEVIALGTLGGRDSYATDVSEDGRTIVGFSDNSAGQTRAFIWRSVMQDYTNIIASFGGMAEETEVVIGERRDMLRQLAQSGCEPGEKLFCLGIGVSGWTTATDQSNGLGSRRSGIYQFNAAVRPLDRLMIGGTLAISDLDLGNSRQQLDAKEAWLGWARYGAVGQSGLHLAAWYGRSKDQIDFQRTAELADVQQMTATAPLKGEVWGASVEYGIPIGTNWTLTPQAAVSRITFDRAGFAEQGGDFPAQFEGLVNKATFASAGLGLSTVAGSGTLMLKAHLERDLEDGPVVVSGTSDIPGLMQFSLASMLERHRTRTSLGAQYDLPIGPVMLRLGAGAESPTYGERWRLSGQASIRGAF